MSLPASPSASSSGSPWRPVPPAPASRTEVQACLADRLGSAIEARWLMEEVLGRGPVAGSVGTDQQQVLRDLVDRRLAGEPLQYVLGNWAFRTLDLAVDHRALIPRPETEQVVEVALAELRGLGDPSPAARSDGQRPVVVDLGTGTGAIALSLAVETGAAVWAVDRDPEALTLAAANLDRVAATRPDVPGRVTLCLGDWFAGLPVGLRGQVHLVVANPPYVAEAEWPDLDPEVRREPHQALVAGDGSDGTPGLADVEAVLRGAADWLARPGAVVVELAPHQARPGAVLAEAAGFTDVRIERDLAGRDRAVVGRVPPPEAR